MREILQEMGLATDNQTLMALSLVQNAIRGNARAAEVIIKILGEKDDLDRQEQRERIKLLRHQNKKQQAIDGDLGSPITIVNHWSE